jgi:HEAT repeat protein
MNEKLNAKVDRIKSLGANRPNAVMRAEVMQALSDKYEGVRSAALTALGNWGGDESKNALKAFLVKEFKRSGAWAIRGVAVKALAPLVDAEDATWVLDLCYGLPSHLEKREVFELICRLPTQAVRSRLILELRSPYPANRWSSCMLIGAMNFPDRKILMAPHCDDEDKLVRQTARVSWNK